MHLGQSRCARRGQAPSHAQRFLRGFGHRPWARQSARRLHTVALDRARGRATAALFDGVRSTSYLQDKPRQPPDINGVAGTLRVCCSATPQPSFIFLHLCRTDMGHLDNVPWGNPEIPQVFGEVGVVELQSYCCQKPAQGSVPSRPKTPPVASHGTNRLQQGFRALGAALVSHGCAAAKALSTRAVAASCFSLAVRCSEPRQPRRRIELLQLAGPVWEHSSGNISLVLKYYVLCGKDVMPNLYCYQLLDAGVYGFVQTYVGLLVCCPRPCCVML